MQFGVFKYRNFRFLWLGATVSASGFTVGNVVMEWMIYHTTHAALLLTLFGVVEFVPMLMVGILAGAIVDRGDRRKLMIISDLVRAGAMATLAITVLFVGFELFPVFVIVAVISVFGTIFEPAAGALLPSLINDEDLSNANGFLEAGRTLASMIGNPLGGIVIFLVGVASGLIYNSTTFAISALAVGMLTVPSSIRKVHETTTEGSNKLLEEVKSGFTFLASKKPLLIMTVASIFLNFFSFYNMYMVVYVLDILHKGPAVFGIILGSSSIGYAVGGVLTGKLQLNKRPGIWVPFTWGLGGLPLIFLILIPVTTISIATMFFEGFLGGLVNTTFISEVQREVPNEFLGRYFTIEQTIGFSMVPLGITVGGLLITGFGLGFSFMLAGTGTLIIGFMLLLNRDIRGWGRKINSE
ncbi:MAG: MFS transporter [Candidatus Thermoplasmatota archaeon]|nr:MFS transporter [Candidatus Thermoplasmatota archaeon]